MSRTVDELRNEIRREVGRFEREISAAFTKEDLTAICEAVGYGIETPPRPATGEMRAGIRRTLGLDDGTDRPFRKAELESIVAAVQQE
jgi:hypothetical protein